MGSTDTVSAPLENPAEREDRGKALVDLIYRDVSWIRRRKDRIEILDDTWIRRQTSIDFVIPDLAQKVGVAPDGTDLYEIPLGLLPVSPLGFSGFDLVDERGRRVALSTLAENHDRNVMALRHAARSALGIDDERTLPDEIDQVATSVGASTSSLISGSALRKVAHAARSNRDAGNELETLRGNPEFMWLMAALVDNSIVAVEIPGCLGQRQVLKLSYYERRLNRPGAEYRRLAKSGLHPYPLIVEVPYVAACSYHMEVLAPDGLEIIDTFSTEFSYAESARNLPDRPSPVDRPDPWSLTADEVSLSRRGSRSHVYIADACDADHVETRVLLRVEREGFVAAAAWTSLLILAILVVLRIDLGGILHRSPVIPSILLIFPGLVATLSGRARDHRLTIRMLSIARRALLLSAGCAFAPAVGLSLSTFGSGQEPTRLLEILWWVCIGLAAMSAATLQLARLLPRQGQLTSTGQPSKLRYRVLDVLGTPFAFALDPLARFRR
ncbi:MAG: hypothetical protein ITG02_09670 [Patulibacter sp.]|nr:hypothetical protein [Patulibacter sp.]